ncbi:hypothetical protein [Gloeothece verrucosa]|uniref:Uncharacterized protein n=1 Tax=Gloeothece verrucosa (strain PCC 7822) TaxID=497965 RepID=E0UM32_GLOV7|nr:hypothetical protein [Gloeothece verrucosa]ADN18012.1 conserved hypothetical protein [Gloeothece verrucosa PCC 7822]
MNSEQFQEKLKKLESLYETNLNELSGSQFMSPKMEEIVSPLSPDLDDLVHGHKKKISNNKIQVTPNKHIFFLK